MDQHELRDKIAKIEALFAGTTYKGERQAAGLALERMLARLEEEKAKDPDEEIEFTNFDSYSKKLLVALLRRYGLSPYRYPRQRYSTVVVKGPQHFIDNVLWPEYKELNKVLTEHLDEVVDKIIAEHICSDTDEEDEVRQLEAS